ncbi:MAG: N-acetylmuramoyl-L-alanine amidase [Janthinobacterium lividum]
MLITKFMINFKFAGTFSSKSKLESNIDYGAMKINTKFRSPNYSFRTAPISFIIIHYTERNFKDSLALLCNYKKKVSAHYLIKSSGEIFNLVEDRLSAWHAGLSHWQGIDKINEHSIGIEIENLGDENFPPIQMEACIDLCNMLSQRYNIDKNNIIGHSDIAPDRKIDPGIFFDWSILASSNLGKWYKIDHKDIEDTELVIKYNEQNTEIMNLQRNLRKIGYKIAMTGTFDLQTNYVVRAFYAHFYPSSIRKIGVNFYRDQDSKYSWNKTVAKILAGLIANA